MQRLSGLDASFLYLETPAQLMHVCGLIVLDPSTGAVSGSITFTAADGSQLYCDFSGNLAAGGGTYTWTGGTGRFADASGEAGFTVEQIDPANFSFTFSGSIELN